MDLGRYTAVVYTEETNVDIKRETRKMTVWHKNTQEHHCTAKEQLGEFINPLLTYMRDNIRVMAANSDLCCVPWQSHMHGR